MMAPKASWWLRRLKKRETEQGAPKIVSATVLMQRDSECRKLRCVGTQQSLPTYDEPLQMHSGRLCSSLPAAGRGMSDGPPWLWPDFVVLRPSFVPTPS